ncbi:MAG TPA: hypothetical protein VFL46_08310 [Phycicoccus sp.]|nr:hypothetical protein [Phycicoccus sp.]
MTHRHDDADPIEHDPTGMRALLGSLPDPGPMPDDLVARITAALDAEGRSGAPTKGDPGPPETVVPLHRRRGWQLLGVAAAAVVAFGVGGMVVDQLAPGGLRATLGLSGGSVDSAAGGAPAEVAAPLGAERSADGSAVLVLASGADYTSAGLAAQAGRLPVPGDDGSKDAAAVPPGAGAVADPAGARSCAGALGVGPSDPVVVDVATMEGRPVAVVVATAQGGVRQAWVVERSCHDGAPAVLAGPVPVG